MSQLPTFDCLSPSPRQMPTGYEASETGRSAHWDVSLGGLNVFVFLGFSKRKCWQMLIIILHSYVIVEYWSRAQNCRTEWNGSFVIDFNRKNVLLNHCKVGLHYIYLIFFAFSSDLTHQVHLTVTPQGYLEASSNISKVEKFRHM